MPENYSKATVQKIAESIEVNNDHEISDLKPNIVVVMSESFFEFGRMLGDEDGKTLYPNVLEHKIGQTVSARFAGGTSNVEFEAMTGFSLNFMPSGTVPYLQFVKRDVPSLPRYLKDMGYATTALHTYHKYYWRRVVAYPLMGMDKFVGLDDLDNPKMYGTYVDDEVINDLIIKELKEEEKPKFIYAITMQNHSMYDDNRFGENTIQFASEYSARSNAMINTYGTGIVHSDKKLKELIESLEKLDEPTLLVFFGDHLPYLDKAYEETGFIKDSNYKTLEEELKMKETPLVAWNNYGKEIDEVGNISTSYLTPHILKWAELPKNKYYQFVEDYSEVLPIYNNILKADKDGNLIEDTPENLIDLENKYRVLQYDLLHGNKYSSNLLMQVPD